MKKFFSSILIVAFMFAGLASKAQTAMQINGLDCNGTSHDLFSELDNGKAAVLFFFMSNCSTCPPIAQKIQTMVNNVLVNHPGMVTGYAMPYTNTTTCTYTSSWVTNNGLSPLYAPYDSGALQVAYYGGFGMPTVVLLGGADHRVMFSTLSFSTSDTTIMRDSILALFAPNGVNEIASNISAANVFPNPTTNDANIVVDLKTQSHLQIDLIDITGKLVANILDEKNATGTISKKLKTENLATGLYTIRITANDRNINRKLNVIH